MNNDPKQIEKPFATIVVGVYCSASFDHNFLLINHTQIPVVAGFTTNVGQFLCFPMGFEPLSPFLLKKKQVGGVLSHGCSPSFSSSDGPW